MSELIISEQYKSTLSLRETERAIKFVKDSFQDALAAELCLERVSAPLFVRKGSGVNDDLNGIEAKATFRVKDAGYCQAECLFSLAKWKRMVLADYGYVLDSHVPANVGICCTTFSMAALLSTGISDESYQSALVI